MREFPDIRIGAEAMVFLTRGDIKRVFEVTRQDVHNRTVVYRQIPLYDINGKCRITIQDWLYRVLTVPDPMKAEEKFLEWANFYYEKYFQLYPKDRERVSEEKLDQVLKEYAKAYAAECARTNC